MRSFLSRIQQMVFIVILGVCLIIYLGLGIIYFQQPPKQKYLEEQILKSLAIVNKPLPEMKKLQEQYDAVNQRLAPIELSEALEIIVGIAERSGINVDPKADKFKIPAPRKSQTEKEATGYDVQSFNQIKVQGAYDSVMAFIADLDAGKTKETMILKRVDIKQVEIRYTAEEAARRAEFREVRAAVLNMMADNRLTRIPHPINYKGGVATNSMAAFPDVNTTPSAKGYTGIGEPKAGYLLYHHDLILSDNTTEFETIDYIKKPTTKYYYTCEADGTVRQFSESDIASATEYTGFEEISVETQATVDIDLYTKPKPGKETK